MASQKTLDTIVKINQELQAAEQMLMSLPQKVRAQPDAMFAMNDLFRVLEGVRKMYTNEYVDLHNALPPKEL